MRLVAAIIVIFLFSNCAAPQSASDNQTIPTGTDAAATKEKGKVKWFNSDKDFGFVIPETGGKSLIFIHQGIKNLKEDQRVEFERVTDEKGVKAVKLKLLD